MDHIAEHKKHLQKKLLVEEHREATALELADIEQMLCRRGVAPVSDSVMALGIQKPGQSSGGGLWSIVSSFRADKSCAAKTKSRKREHRRQQGKVSGTSGSDVVRAILREHGYKDEDIEASLALYGPDLQRCVEFCLNPCREGPR